MRKFVYNRILLIVISVGLIAALAIAGQRHAVEIHNNRIDMAVDYESLLNLSEGEGVPFDEVLKAAKDAGITSLAIYDTTFEKLNRSGKVLAISGEEILKNYHGGSLVNALWREAVENGNIDATKVYIVGRTLKNYEETKADLIRRVGPDRVRPFAIGEIEVLEVKARYSQFLKMPLGIPTEELETAKNAGFKILARPRNYEKCTPEDVRAVFDRLNGYPISEIVFDGKEILGAENFVDVTAEEIKNRGWTLGLIEHTTQLQFYPQSGMQQLARQLGYDKVARLSAIPRDVQPKLLLADAVNRWVTTDHERNIRVNLLRIYEKPAPEMNLLETNLEYFKSVSDKLKAQGYTLGAAGTFSDYYPNRILRALVIIGTVAACVLYLSLISRRINSNLRLQTTLLVAFSILAVIPILMGSGVKVRVIAALLSANVFPALAIIW